VLRSCSCVSGDTSAEWVDDVLDRRFGLTDRERMDFVSFWQPHLEKSAFNLIRFLDAAEIDEDSRMSVSPRPDTIIRVFMIFQPVDKARTTRPQPLLNAGKERTGFTVVEWGGSCLTGETVEMTAGSDGSAPPTRVSSLP
jgi:hypothetical protein